MTDITPVLNHYRIATRSIWNTAFWPDPEYRHWDAFDQFEEIRRLLFDALVLARLDKSWDLPRLFREPIPLFRVIIDSACGAPVMISNPKGDRNLYWDDPVNRMGTDDATLQFLDFYDFEKMDYADFDYYRVRISEFPAHPHLVGRDALVRIGSAKVFLVDVETPSDVQAQP